MTVEEVDNVDDTQPKAEVTEDGCFLATFRETTERFADKVKRNDPLTEKDIPQL